MSMTGHFKQITPDQLQDLKKDPALVKNLISSSDGAYLYGDSDGHLDMGKAWQVIHFILTGDPWEGEGPLSSVIMGGVNIGRDLGYGPVRYLETSEVKQISDAISSFTAENFKSNFYSPEITKQYIYGFQDQSEQELEYFLTTFEKIRAFYDDCANKGNAMLTYLT